VILVDTNIPARIAQPGHPHRQPAIDAMKLLASRDSETFAISAHSLYELYFVMTKSKNGFGFESTKATSEIVQVRKTFRLLHEGSGTYKAWEELVSKYAVTGRRAYDTKLVATMVVHRVPQLLTFNDADFVQFAEIAVLNPFDVIGTTRV
jgi:predicted nucleic acid-binding protein